MISLQTSQQIARLVLMFHLHIMAMKSGGDLKAQHLISWSLLKMLPILGSIDWATRPLAQENDQ